ncbi:MAG: ABC transporter ATP-binding protein, partial [Sulfurimicrobium sp.]|nr:ABC transporter ATP-binding protein [Sulfurimicrobium sp.]
DLDIETLELLESLLQDYNGTVLLVSHDRTFLDNVVTQVIAFEGDGKLQEYAGGYDDYVRVKRAREAVTEKKNEPSQKTAPKSTKSTVRAKLNFNETRELETLPGKIEALEREQEEIGAKLADPDIYRSDPAEAKHLQERVNVIDEELLEALARWEVLEAKQKGAE